MAQAITYLPRGPVRALQPEEDADPVDEATHEGPEVGGLEHFPAEAGITQRAARLEAAEPRRWVVAGSSCSAHPPTPTIRRQ